MEMKNKINLILMVAALLSLFSCTLNSDRYIKIEGYAQGGVYTVTLNLKDIEPAPEEIRDSIEAILHRIDFTLSGYNKNSILSRFNQGDTVLVTDMFADMYNQAHEIYELTSGVVDVAAAPLFDLWGFGFKSGEMPSDEQVSAALEVSGMRRLCPALAAGMLLTGSDMLAEGVQGASPVLNYNAVAQGYSCDLVAGYLYSIGVKDMMVNIGEMFCDGVNPSGKSWTIGIDRPVDGNNELGSQMQGIFKAPQGPHGIVTSGNYRKFYIKDGRKYAHTIDTRTGYPVMHNLLSATIVAENAMLADAYATYCMAVGLEESIRFLSENRDLEGCLIYDEDGVFSTWCSEGFVLEEVPLH